MKEYKIKKGKHSSRPRLIKPWIGRKEFNFKFKLHKNCWYPSNYVDISGISKICGISLCIHNENPLNKISFIRPFINSIIVGWMPDFNNKNKFILFIINDDRGKETRPQWIGPKINAEELINVNIIRNKEYVKLTINGISKFYYINTKIPFGYYLGFYHGGYDVAYHNMSSELEIN